MQSAATALRCEGLRRLASAQLMGGLLMAICVTGSADRASGPLRIHPQNPRYFTDGSGRHVGRVNGTHCLVRAVGVGG